MRISAEEVQRIAKLSKLSFSEKERDQFSITLSRIIDMISLLNEVDTQGVAFTSNVADNINRMRKDQSVGGWDRKELFKNIPGSGEDLIKVPVVIDREDNT